MMQPQVVLERATEADFESIHRYGGKDQDPQPWPNMIEGLAVYGDLQSALLNVQDIVLLAPIVSQTKSVVTHLTLG